MPKARYRIMREYLPTRGSRSLEMMFVTATVQANFDYASEADMVSKVRTAVAVSPIVSAIFANSSLYLGKDSGFASRRLAAWFDTDPDRCGMPPWVFDPDFGYERYVEWALDVPMFFVVRDGTYHFAKGATFRHFLERGFEGHRAVLDDWDRHLTTLFPDVRLKRYIEVRCADAVPPGLTCSLPALWKGIFYDDQALASAWALVEGLDIEQREAARVEVAKRGLASQMGSQPILELAHELAAIAREGLARIGDAGRNDADECAYLDPIFEQLESGLSPGETVAVRWEAEWGRSIDRLIDFARY
jgi:glutamate--cysteine ligase